MADLVASATSSSSHPLALQQLWSTRVLSSTAEASAWTSLYLTETVAATEAAVVDLVVDVVATAVVAVAASVVDVASVATAVVAVVDLVVDVASAVTVVVVVADSVTVVVAVVVSAVAVAAVALPQLQFLLTRDPFRLSLAPRLLSENRKCFSVGFLRVLACDGSVRCGSG